MWPFSGPARNELAQSHTAAAKLVVLRAGIPCYTLTAVTGSISTDAERSVMRNLTATVTDPTGLLSGADVDDLLNPYSCEVQPFRGVYVPATGTTEWAPQGVFQLTGRMVSGDGSIDLDGQDRSIIYQGNMTATLPIGAGTATETAIAQLLVTRNRGLRMKTWKTGFTVGPLIYAPDIDVWKEAQALAQSAGGRLYHDRTGLLVFAPALPVNPRPVVRFADGDGLLLDVKRQEDSDQIHNVIVAEKEAGSTIRAVVQDTNPASPTYAGGKYGYRVSTITNASINTVTQAQQVARNELVRELGRTETVSISVVPDPTLDVWEGITVNRPTADLNNQGLVMASMTLPLAVTDAMSINCRKFILTENGQQINDPLQVTTS